MEATEAEDLTSGEPPDKRLKANDTEHSNAIAKLTDCTQTGSIQEGNQNAVISKRQLKKLKKKEKWLAYKPLKRAKEKEKLKQKRLHARLNNIRLGHSRKELKRSKMSQSNCKIRVVVDLSFDHLMNDKDMGKCIKQVLRCYSLNRRAKEPMQLYITSFNGRSEKEMGKNTGYRNWDVHFSSESYAEVFDLKDIIYLTSDSENVISALEDDKVYVIGGLVDHNAQKGLCLSVAKNQGINHGQLPIGEFVEMKTRKVLTIDHVFEILLGVSAGKSWKDAFLDVLPSRKGVSEKNENLEKTESLSNEDSAEHNTNSVT